MCEVELKACPFCGNKPGFNVKPESWGYHGGSVEVKCSCGASAAYQDDEGKKKEAAEEWNKRV